jgi:hypothetical protein
VAPRPQERDFAGTPYVPVYVMLPVSATLSIRVSLLEIGAGSVSQAVRPCLSAQYGECQRRSRQRRRAGGPAACRQGSRGGWGHGRLLVGNRRGQQASGVQLDRLQAPLPDDQGDQAQVAGHYHIHIDSYICSKA